VGGWAGDLNCRFQGIPGLLVEKMLRISESKRKYITNLSSDSVLVPDPMGEYYTCSAGKKSRLLMNLKAHYHVHMNPHRCFPSQAA
jgi:hypothetical protein